MLSTLRKVKILKKVQKTMLYTRLRQYFPMAEYGILDDRDKIEDETIVTIDWPENIRKPSVGIVKDYEICPYWTKYYRFLEKNAFPFEIYDILRSDWLENAKKFDVVIGIPSSAPYHTSEIRQRYYVLEKHLGIACFPRLDIALLYENKSLEGYLAEVYHLPMAKTYVSHDKDEAMQLVEKLSYPFVSKIDPSSASVGVELVRNVQQGRKIVQQAFSRNGRKVHLNYFRQKNYVYFQEFVPNDGHDIRVMIVGNWAFGYFRKVLGGDFRASGMGMVEKRELPEEAIRTAWNMNKAIKSPMLIVDMVQGLDGTFSIVEYSPICQMETPEQLHNRGVPGFYVVEEDGRIHFEEGRYWLAALALREFFLKEYIPSRVQEPADQSLLIN